MNEAIPGLPPGYTILNNGPRCEVLSHAEWEVGLIYPTVAQAVAHARYLEGMEPITYEIGEACHVWVDGHQGETMEGKVVAVLDLPGWSFPNYVIEIETHIDPVLEVRSGFMMFRLPVKRGKLLKRGKPL